MESSLEPIWSVEEVNYGDDIEVIADWGFVRRGATTRNDDDAVSLCKQELRQWFAKGRLVG